MPGLGMTPCRYIGAASDEVVTVVQQRCAGLRQAFQPVITGYRAAAEPVEAIQVRCLDALLCSKGINVALTLRIHLLELLWGWVSHVLLLS